MAQAHSRQPSKRLRIAPETLWKRYVAAFVVLLAFVAGGQIIEYRIEHQGHPSMQAINISGQQRMLSQRMELLAGKYVETGRDRYATYLMRARSQFLENHEWLMTHAVPKTPGMTVFYGPQGRDLDRRSRDYAEIAWKAIVAGASSKSASAVLDQMESQGLNALLIDLDRAVNIYEKVANARIARLHDLSRLSDAALVVVLLLQILFVFYPAHRTLSGTIRRLGHQARHDALTGLANRVGIMELLEDFCAKNPSALQNIVLIALDLDGFKAVNDTYGHDAGDRLLKTVAAKLQAAADAQSGLSRACVARMGGDEFLIAAQIQPGEKRSAAAETLGNCLIAEISQPMVISLETGERVKCRIGTSVGYAMATPGRWTVEQVINDADLALYESKRNGKGIVTRFDPRMRAAVDRLHQLERDMRAGLGREEFTAHFQPQVDMTTGAVVGVEALARWQHPGEGLLLPGEFLEISCPESSWRLPKRPGFWTSWNGRCWTKPSLPCGASGRRACL